MAPKNKPTDHNPLGKREISLPGHTIPITPGPAIDEISVRFDTPIEQEKKILLGGSLADVTRNTPIDMREETRVLKFFYAGDSSAKDALAAALHTAEIPVDQHFSVARWSSPDPLRDGCLECFTITRDPSKNVSQSLDVLDFICLLTDELSLHYHEDAWSWNRKEQKYEKQYCFNNTQNYLRKLYKNVPRKQYTRAMRVMNCPSFDIDPDDFIGVSFGILLSQRGPLRLWSVAGFHEKG